MKKSIFRTGALLLGLLLMLAGCAEADPAPQGSTAVDQTEAYRVRVNELEAELQKAREEQFITNSRYEAQIAELQKQLAALSGNIQTGGSSTGSSDKITFLYQLHNDKAIITGVEGDTTLLNIPSELDGYTVVGIGERAFEGKSIVAAILPEGLVSVGWFAFYGCEALGDVTFPASVSSIGYAVFDGCPNVSIVCPAGSFAEQYAESFGLSHVTT